MILFVYGSLKKGFYNHERFGFDKIPFIGKCELKGYELFSLGHYPGMVPTNSESDVVKGELYDINDASPEFIFLDRIERGAGFGLSSVKILEKKDFPKLSKLTTAYAYTYHGGDYGAKIENGEWEE